MDQQAKDERDDREALIERIVAKAELEFKCSGSHFGCSGDAPGVEQE